MDSWPDVIGTVEELEEVLSRPSPRLVESMARLDGDVMVIGAGGKIGPTLSLMARRAIQAAGVRKEVIGVDRCPVPQLSAAGIATLACDLTDLAAVERLPRVRNIIFMAGRKFGSTGDEPGTWAANVVVPYHVARTFTSSRILVFSTGCVYPLMPVSSGGATEDTPPAPVGEYAMSCLGRERVFEYSEYPEHCGVRDCRDQGAKRGGAGHLLLRLNYAVELRYGVLADVARRVADGQPVDVTTGFVNVIWQGDACNQALLALGLVDRPARILNVTGPETLSIRQTARLFGRLLGKDVTFSGRENGLGYLSNSARATALFGPPAVPAGKVMEWIAHWIAIGGMSHGKPTHFETQDGRY